MAEQIPLDESAIAAATETDDTTHEVAPDLAYKRLGMVNVAFFGLSQAGDREWVLIDAGVRGGVHFIKTAAAKRFGEHSRPAAIVLTHGHFDHTSGLPELAENWDAEVYAHALEMPYLDGRSSYPPPDPTVGGGIMPSLAPLFPRGPINVSRWLRSLPDDGSVPGMPDWKWLHTPGHAPGHVSLWRESDRTLVAGDAFITTNQESAYAVTVQAPEMHGPPRYFTPDWESARASVQMLAELEPELVITGHGRAMRGEEMREALRALARNFDEVAVPDEGRYIGHPAGR